MNTNLVENAIRRFVIGRKHWLFADTVAGARASASANLYSLIGTAKPHGIEPYRHLAHLFELLPAMTSHEPLEAILPQNLAREALHPR